MRITIPLRHPEGAVPAIPKGKYRVRLQEVREGKKTKSGAAMVSLKFVVLSGRFQGRILWDNLAFSDAALGRLAAFLRSANLPHEGEAVEINTVTWIGRELNILVDVEHYEGTERNTVKKFFPTPSTLRNTNRAVLPRADSFSQESEHENPTSGD